MSAAITPPTPENVAGMLTEADNDYHDGNYWHPSIGADGNVVHIGITAYTDNGEKLPEVHFRAVVVEAPSFRVASAPVELYAELARGLTYTSPGKTRDDWTVVAVEDYDRDRWESHHQLVIRNETGLHYAAYFSKGLTEYQDTRPWEGETTATFTPVVPQFKVVTEWVSAEAAQAGTENDS